MNSSCFFRMRRKELPEETVEAEAISLIVERM